MDTFKIIQEDGYLKPFEGFFKEMQYKFQKTLKDIETSEGNLLAFSQTYKHFGINEKEGYQEIQEWLPEAREVFIFGDFNSWNRHQYKMEKKEFGKWKLILEFKDNKPIIHENSRYKLHILDYKNKWIDRISPWAKYAIQNAHTNLYDGVHVQLDKYKFQHPKPDIKDSLKIYEAHIGMSSQEGKVCSYNEFKENLLPRIKKLGYNCIQLMAIQEHAYYGSFGYHVTNFFAVSSRYGKPEELQQLIDRAHELGIKVLLDIVHSHASKNSLDGINQLDGSDFQYFHEGPQGDHQLWDSRCFDYSKYEVLRFLLSNVSFYLQEYQFDGFRFDGVTSMLYKHHGIGVGFTGNYNEYFGDSTDKDALNYIMLVNDLIHAMDNKNVTIAEDVSGMVNYLKSLDYAEKYKMEMAIPDYWIKLLKEQEDPNWDIKDLAYTLMNRRYSEKHIAYTESHDQALVGDKTIAMWLFNEEIYKTLKVSRGMALHKMLRLITIAMGGEAYLNFMGNEFGHPEWIDFPRQGNNWSYHYCRRQWSLSEDKNLRYSQLNEFDGDMIKMEKSQNWLNWQENYLQLTHQDDKIIIYERKDLIFIFNFHYEKSFENYSVGTQFNSDHVLLFHTDKKIYGGYDRLQEGQNYPYENKQWNNRKYLLKVYIPCRTGLILKAKN